MSRNAFLIALLLIICSGIQAQKKTIPYFSGFETPTDLDGWKHYSIYGTDDWVAGRPSKPNISDTYFGSGAWATNLSTSCATSSNRALETPYFDLRDITQKYALSFYHQRSGASYYSFRVEYKTGKNGTWALYNDASANKVNWQGSSGFTNIITGYTYSSITLWPLQGKDSVQFRFRMVSVDAADGWAIDNFWIMPEVKNIIGLQGDTVKVTQNTPTYSVNSPFDFINVYGASFDITTKYYFSTDKTWDANDKLVGTRILNTGSPTSNHPSPTITLDKGLKTGYYYLLHKIDALNVVPETDENDNVGFSVIVIDSVYTFPYIQNFEDNSNHWKTYADKPTSTPLWQLGEGYRHHTEGAHSGKKAWHTSKSADAVNTYCQYCNQQYLETPPLNLKSATSNIVLNFWYKAMPYSGSTTIEYNSGTGGWNPLYTFAPGRQDDWDFANIWLPGIASYDNLRLRVNYYGSYANPEGIVLDDIYIGYPKPDLSVERDLANRFTANDEVTDTLVYFICNSGLAPTTPFSTSFYWSNDSILDGSDVLLGSRAEPAMTNAERKWTSFVYSKPNLSSGKYYILFAIDPANAIDEMREYNNTGYFVIYQENRIKAPYLNDFETQVNGWRHNASLGKDNWTWTTPTKKVLDKAFSGNKGWITSDTGSVSGMSRMHLYSPIFDLSEIADPVLEFDMKNMSLSFETGSNISYSTDRGATWTVLDTTDQSFKCMYYYMVYENYGGYDKTLKRSTTFLMEPSEPSFSTYNDYQSRDTWNTMHYIIHLKPLRNCRNVQFRFNLGSAKTQSEGLFIDNFKVSTAWSDLTTDRKRHLMISSLAKDIKFTMDISNKGNYISKPGKIKFYLSADSTETGSAFLLGEENVPAIRPTMRYHVNSILAAPSDLSIFKYLIWQLDADNTTPETNEENNPGFWFLSKDSIKSLPYIQDFSDTIINGWSHYEISVTGEHKKNGYRFRNILAPSENLSHLDIHSGQMFTEKVNPVMRIYQVPFWHLETPAFDFSKTDSVLIMSFDLMCIGRSTEPRDGGNMEFTTDGGKTWKLLTKDYGSSGNWYNHDWLDIDKLENVKNEPGWAWEPPSGNVAELKHIWYDVSFLKGNKSVIFRIKYRSNSEPYGTGTVSGMRVDNFKMEGIAVDYIGAMRNAAVLANKNLPNITVNYSIKNTGKKNGIPSLVRFYWSKDSILDVKDSLLLEQTIPTIGASSTLNSPATVKYPHTLEQATYYILYKSDADSVITEISEKNNIGSFLVSFPSYANYVALDRSKQLQSTVFETSLNVPYRILNNGLVNGTTSRTAFYWSGDSILDVNDLTIHLEDEASILTGDTLKKAVTFPLPSGEKQRDYYLFYSTDCNNTVHELNDLDNKGVFKVHFKFSQEIAMEAAKEVTYDGSPLVPPTESSAGLPIDLVSSNPAVALVYAGKIYLMGPGTCNIIASQAGNEDYVAVTVTQVLTVLPRPIILNGVAAKSKIYDGTVSAEVTGGKLTGHVFADNVNLVKGTAEFEDSNAGENKAIIFKGYGITGEHAFKYTLSLPEIKANIEPAPVNITGIVAQDKIYDGTTSVTLSGGQPIGVLGTDDVSLVTGTGVFADKKAGSNKAILLSGYSLTGTHKNNYKLIGQPIGVKASILPALLNVSGVIVHDKIYDGYTNAWIEGGSIYGQLGEDQVFLQKGAGHFTDRNVGTNKTIITSSYGLYGPDALNYRINQPLGITADILPRPLTIKANPGQSKMAGTPDPELLFSITEGELAPADSFHSDFLTGKLGRAPGEDPGVYPVNLGSLGNSNYVISFVPDNFTILNSTTGIPSFYNHGLKIYPNPTSGKITLEYQNGNLTVLTMDGKLILQYCLKSDPIVDLSGLPAGPYFLRLETKNKVYLGKLIKN